MERIADYAFQKSMIKEYKMPDTVTEVGEGIFWESELERIVWSKGCPEVPLDTFFACRKLTSVELPEGVTRIGMNAFWECTSLRKITIPSTVTFIDDDAFGNCENLERVTLLNPDVRLGYGVFDGCPRVQFYGGNGLALDPAMFDLPE